MNILIDKDFLWCHESFLLHRRLKNFGTDLLIDFLGIETGYLTGWRLSEVWITWIKYWWYRFQCFCQSKPFIALSFLVFKMFDTYIWWITRFPILSICKWYPYLSKLFFFREKENCRFFFASVVWTAIHHTALKNHRIYIDLQHLLNLISNITTLLCWYKRVLFSQQHFYEHTYTKTTWQETKKSYKEKRQVFFCL